MAIEILTSAEDNICYFYNLGYLNNAVRRGDVQEEAGPFNYNEEFVFDGEARIYDFTRTAKAKVQKKIFEILSRQNVLPGLQRNVQEEIEGMFGCYLNYEKYKQKFKQIGGRREESMSMLIFNNRNGEGNQPPYVAHVTFESISRRTGDQQFKVDVTLVCQRVTYFQVQNEDISDVLQALGDLNV